MRTPHTIFTFLLLLICLSITVAGQKQQTANSIDRERGLSMLDMIKTDIKDKYYDDKFHGMDLETRFATAKEKVKNAQSLGQIFGIIAQVLLELKDSHTRFIPPARAYRTEYGWMMQILGEKAFVTAVKPNSDAESKGLRPGDEILKMDDYIVDRGSINTLQYLYYSLRPQPGIVLTVKHIDGKEEKLAIAAKIIQKKRVIDPFSEDIWDLIREDEREARLNRHRMTALGKSAYVWKMPAFDLEPSQVDDIMGKAKNYPFLILDLRGNGGGSVKTLGRLVGEFFDKDIKIADWKGRKDFEPQIAKTRGHDIFTGKVIVLIDSDSASAAEMFARVMQLEKRGEVLGDLTSGMVMVSKYQPHKIGADVQVFYGASVTIADTIMSDGKSLEGLGVMPDKRLIPSALAVSKQLDPVLAYAAEMAGVKLSPEEAGKLFPIEWP